MTLHDSTGDRTDGPLKYLVYTSAARPGLGNADLEDILTTARQHNASADITGILLFRDRCFVQFLEGRAADVDALMLRIAADSRHSKVRIILTDTVTERSFSDWKMGYRRLEDADTIGADENRDSFDDLTSDSPDEVVRSAAAGIPRWFRATEAAASA